MEGYSGEVQYGGGCGREEPVKRISSTTGIACAFS